jgi:hypothetical protein
MQLFHVGVFKPMVSPPILTMLTGASSKFAARRPEPLVIKENRGWECAGTGCRADQERRLRDNNRVGGQIIGNNYVRLLSRPCTLT